MEAQAKRAAPAARRTGAGGLAAEIELATRLRLAIARLARRMRTQETFGLTPSQLSVLATLEQIGPATLGELAAAERVTPPSMTRIVCALEGGGLVVRAPDAGDRRVARVALSPKAYKTLSRVRAKRGAYLAKHLGSLSEQERVAVEAAIPVLEKMVEELP